MGTGTQLLGLVNLCRMPILLYVHIVYVLCTYVYTYVYVRIRYTYVCTYLCVPMHVQGVS